MKTFKQYIAELHGEQRTSELIFRGTNYPLSPSIFKRLFGEEKFTAFHITGLVGVEKIIALQGKKKAISTFTNLDDTNLLLRGIGGNGGAVVMLEGTKLLSSETDLHTQVDSSGYRWIKPSHTIGDFEAILSPIVLKAKANVWKKFEKKLDPIVDVSEIFDAGFEDQWEEITYIKDTKLKGQVVAAFFDEIEKISAKEKEVLEDLFSDTPDPDIRSTGIQLAVDETVMTNFTVKRIWLIEVGSQAIDPHKYRKGLKELTKKFGKKYKLEVLKNNIGDMRRIKGYIKAVARNRRKA